MAFGPPELSDAACRRAQTKLVLGAKRLVFKRYLEWQLAAGGCCPNQYQGTHRTRRLADATRGNAQHKRRFPPVYNAVIFLSILTLVLLALIYWGGFKEESRNR
jgi:hypothetical protein